MDSIVFHAFVEKYTKSIANCIKKLVTHKEALGDSFSFSFVKNFGKVPFFAISNGISATIIVQDSQLAKVARISPIFISQAPHFPTTASKTPAVEGSGITAS